jgi:methylase of polypeptide subunit release factors
VGEQPQPVDAQSERIDRLHADRPGPGIDRLRVDRLRADLAGFTVDAVDELLGPVAHGALGREHALPARIVVQGLPDDPLATLVAVFVLGLEVPRHRLAAALPTVGLADLEQLKLIRVAGADPDDAVRASVDLRPYAAVDALGTADWLLISARGELAPGRPLASDHVLGVGGASLTLARCTIRRPVERVLDLGTGCGVQALHAGRHARSVIGTDTSARALRMAELNWLLNRSTVAGAEFATRQGSLLDPVADERFDLVVSNPPFVITPRSLPGQAYEYRDGGMVGDELVRRLVTSVGSVLRPGGVAQLLGNWEQRRGESWTERVSGWLAESGLDGWVVQREMQDPAEYAETWIRDAGQHLSKDADELYAAWLADFSSRQVEGVGFGLVTLRKPLDAATGDSTGDAGTPSGGESRPTPRRAPNPPVRGGPIGAGIRSGGRLRRLEERRTGPGLPTGNEILAGLIAHDWLAVRDDAALLNSVLLVAADITEERHLIPGADDPSVILLRQGGGAGRVVQASTALAGLVGACSGELTVGQLTGALSGLLEVPEADLSAELLPAVRSLITDGFLHP